MFFIKNKNNNVFKDIKYMEQKSTFYSDLNTRIITRVTIINTKLINSTGFLNSEYILYIFKIITPFKSWYIKKRYSEIKVLFDYLVSQNPKLKFPVFPPKRFLSTKESTIIERKNGFEELFFFVLNNIEILKFAKLINFFLIHKTILVIYIKNCILVNENKYTYELLDIVNSSSSSNDLSQNSDDSNKDKNIEIKQDKNPPKKQFIQSEGNKSKEDLKSEVDEKDNKINQNANNSTDNINNVIININNINNSINEQKNNNSEKKVYNNLISSNGNYLRCFEDFKLASEKLAHRSQCSFLIVKEFLRNLKIHSSHIFEIINDFTDYLKYKKKWKKFNQNEINALLIGIKKEELIDDYYQYIFTDEKSSFKNTTSISEKTTLSSTPNSININSIISHNNTINFNKTNSINATEDDFNNKNNSRLEGLLYYIGKFEENYFGARNCLLLLYKFFDRQFNPEVEFYMNIFRKIDIKFIKKMNLCKLCFINNGANQKICFDILNIYIEGYDEKKQVKILNDLNASKSLIDKILYSNYNNSINDSYNLE